MIQPFFLQKIDKINYITRLKIFLFCIQITISPITKMGKNVYSETLDTMNIWFVSNIILLWDGPFLAHRVPFSQAFSYLTQSVLNNLQILNSIVDPLVQMCSVSASRLNTTDMATYMINCIYLIQNNLALYEFTDTRLEMLQAQVLVFTNNYYHYLRVVMRALINI